MRRVVLFLLLAGLLASGQGHWSDRASKESVATLGPPQKAWGQGQATQPKSLRGNTDLRTVIITKKASKSMHHNYYEDRLWDFGCKDTSIKSTECFLSHYVNNFDQEFTFQCPTNYVIAGMHSFHNNYYEDRRWQFYCCRSKCEVSSNCQWSSYVNEFDETFYWYVPYHHVLVGAGSYHHNYYELWEFGCKDTFDSGSDCFLSPYANDFDQPLNFVCPPHNFMAGMSSNHNNKHEDRRWQFYCCRSNGHCTDHCEWTTYVNWFDEYFHWNVPNRNVPNQNYLVGAESYHENKHE
ncbi:Hemagglutinin/amebocyte aggregation factor [Anabarilius grahami]|uniref:Hemagglutinin/amebocyte aggregation factor n=1 Tax=Anabarilius grahami TaxID=495550 RepID=A0A3N0XD39_ANAGA|nr:Hemagglutinin/amebocyte aggregation factor [Anabarilius grahami]